MESLSTLFHLFLDEEPCYCYLQHFGLTKWSARQGLKVFPPQGSVSVLVCPNTRLDILWISAWLALSTGCKSKVAPLG